MVANYPHTAARSFRTAALTAFIALVALPAFNPSAASAETVVSTELTAMISAEKTESGGTGFYNISDGKFSLTSTGSSEVKAQLTVDVKLADTVLIDITKAWVKAQLASVRLTAGKTRLSWGEGYMYNAGDVIFSGKNADLSAEELRDNNAWLAAVYLPLGNFSFVEAVLLPPDLPVMAYQQYSQAKKANPANPSLTAPALASPDKSSGGGRLYAKLGGVKVESGYLYDGTDALGKPYVSLQGHLLADFHLSSGIALPVRDALKQETLESWQITGGLLYQLPLTSLSENPASGSLDFRLEARLNPYGEWKAEPLPAAAFSPLEGSGNEGTYALSVFPQVSWKSDTLFAYARGVWSPVDGSGLAGVGLHWGPLQGFKILGGFSAQMGGDGDVYSWEYARGWQFTLGTRVNF